MNSLTFLNQIAQTLRVPSFGINWIDFIVIGIAIIYIIEGFAFGFIRGVLDLLSFLASFVLGLTFYSVIATILVKNLSIPQGFSNAIGFFTIALIAEIIFAFIARRLVIFFHRNASSGMEEFYNSKLNNFLGIIPGFASAIVLLSFILTMLITLPLSPFLKTSVSSSRFGSLLVSDTQGLEKSISNVFGGAVSDALTFLTVEPQSDESVNLNFTISKASVDPQAEQDMFASLNYERTSRGVPALTFDDSLRDVGRNHCTDMFKRGYFSHYTPEGESPFDRMAKDNISFTYAGENLALAPNTKLAMQGLMNSPGHKANILNKNFGRVGIGVINGGIYGEMFCQEFTN